MCSQCRWMRRRNLDKQPKNKMQKEEKLEEFSSFRTSKRRKQRVNKETKMRRRRRCYNSELFCVRKTQMRDKATKFAIETEEKTYN